MNSETLQRLAVPGVCALVAFLAYGSQLLFPGIDPGSLTSQQKLIFNALVACIWVCYGRAVLTDPGHVPAGWKPEATADNGEAFLIRQRHCRRCDALKPPRAHHCKVCKR